MTCKKPNLRFKVVPLIGSSSELSKVMSNASFSSYFLAIFFASLSEILGAHFSAI